MKRLLIAAHQGDERARYAIYERTYPAAFTVALHYAGDTAAAEDIVQDSFIKLFRELDRKPFTGAFKPWFRRIVVNTSIDHYRTTHRRNGLLNVFMRERQKTTAQNEATNRLEMNDMLKLLQQLSPRYRMVVNLYVMEGYTHPEIARELGISVGTSKSNYAKARIKLRALAPAFFATKTTNDHG